jgi:hypothetical protein
VILNKLEWLGTKSKTGEEIQESHLIDHAIIEIGAKAISFWISKGPCGFNVKIKREENWLVNGLKESLEEAKESCNRVYNVLLRGGKSEDFVKAWFRLSYG